MSAAGAAGVLGARVSLADEGPPETTTIRIRVEDAPPLIVGGVTENALCIAPTLITEELLRAEGFTDIRYVLVKNGPPYTQAFELREIDFSTAFRGRPSPQCRRADHGAGGCAPRLLRSVRA
jgi:NitT/TauT family transport system substrate-binding protein